MTLEELLRDHALANAELNATRTKYGEAHDLQLEHNKMMLEYSVKSRDLSSEVKLRENKVLRIGKAIRTEKIKQKTGMPAFADATPYQACHEVNI